MSMRANYFGLASGAMNLLLEQESWLHQQFGASENLSVTVLELVKLRVSQINQCAFCLDMHTSELRSKGESVERIVGLSAWRDMPLYSEPERMALAFAEHLTAGNSVDDGYYQQLVDVMGEQDLVNLTIAVNAINSWNRVAKTFKPEVGSYKAS